MPPLFDGAFRSCISAFKYEIQRLIEPLPKGTVGKPTSSWYACLALLIRGTHGHYGGLSTRPAYGVKKTLKFEHKEVIRMVLEMF